MRRALALSSTAGGGLISFGHPVGATGLKQIYEVWAALVGVSPYVSQKKRGVTVNMGGEDKTVVMGAFEKAA